MYAYPRACAPMHWRVPMEAGDVDATLNHRTDRTLAAEDAAQAHMHTCTHAWAHMHRRIGLSPQKMLHVASVNPRDLCMISCSHSD